MTPTHRFLVLIPNLFFFSCVLCPGLQTSPRFAQQSPRPVWPDWARVWKSLHWKPWMWVTAVSIRVSVASEHRNDLITDTLSRCQLYSTPGNWLAERASDCRWTGGWWRRPQQGSPEGKRYCISYTVCLNVSNQVFQIYLQQVQALQQLGITKLRMWDWDRSITCWTSHERPNLKRFCTQLLVLERLRQCGNQTTETKVETNEPNSLYYEMQASVWAAASYEQRSSGWRRE